MLKVASHQYMPCSRSAVRHLLDVVSEQHALITDDDDLEIKTRSLIRSSLGGEDLVQCRLLQNFIPDGSTDMARQSANNISLIRCSAGGCVKDMAIGISSLAVCRKYRRATVALLQARWNRRL